jgi:transcriptional coactivator YAP1
LHIDDSHINLMPPSQAKVDENEEQLPDFWEEVRLDDGRILFVNHVTETTTWDDPRRTRGSSPPPELQPSAWTAQLVAGSLDETGALQQRVDGSRSGIPFPDLAEEGYVLDEETSGPIHPDALPDFWEMRRGTDGWNYYIDHIGTRIVRE